jgi:low molecular weight protein-tyrosine phosphatase
MGSPPRRDLLSLAFVCTGNRARSSFAEGLIRRDWSDRVVVASFGTRDVGPAPALPLALETAKAFGVDLSDHSATALSRGSLEAFDLVLGFERSHVAAAVVDGNADRAVTFLLRECADLLGTVRRARHGPDDPRRLIAEADSLRVRSSPDPGAGIDDPLGKSADTFRATFDAIDSAVRQLTSILLDESTAAIVAD